MEDTKVQIGDDCLLDLGVNSKWYISTLCYNNESVNVELRRKADRYIEWWRAEQTEQTEPTMNPDLIKFEEEWECIGVVGTDPNRNRNNCTLELFDDDGNYIEPL